MRTLHTLKGGARLAGAMRLGERAHRLETAIERLAAQEHVGADAIEALFGKVDAIGSTFEILCGRAAPVAQRATRERVAPAVVELPISPTPPALAAVPPAAPANVIPLTRGGDTAPIDWQRFASGAPSATVMAECAADRRSESRASSGTVRVQAPLLDRLVNHLVDRMREDAA